jgi:hypothetical protein
MMRAHRSRVLLTQLLLVVVACHREPNTEVVRQFSDPEPPLVATSSGSVTGEFATVSSNASVPRELEPPFASSYARAAWRLAAPGSLQPVVLWFSQLVIRHENVRPEVSFNLAYWKSVAAPPRSRADALALAEHVAKVTSDNPERFADLARQYSDDLPSRDEGGELGGLSAVQLTFWPQVLDALAALNPGQVSRVVETRYGFHIFYRVEPPGEERRSGAHIVIGHDAAPWLSVYARRVRPRRTREEALALANDIYRLAHARPEGFRKLVHMYSEHRDAIADGDFGQWSTREPNAFPPRIKRLGELAIGQVGKPIETHLGFEIIQRTAPRQRSLYRAAVLSLSSSELSGSEPVDSSPAQRLQARQSAEIVALQLGTDPASFDTATVQQWEEGRGPPELTLAVSRVQPGEMVPVPVDTETGFVLAKRLKPERVLLEQFASELPSPDPGALARFLASRGARDSLAFLRRFAVRAAQDLTLERVTRDRLIVLHDLVPLDDNAGELEARMIQLGDLFKLVHELLGDERYARYHAACSQEAAVLSESPSDSSLLGL